MRDTTKVKQYLRKKYNLKNSDIKVKRGTGTAYGWIHIYILKDKINVEEFNLKFDLINNMKDKVQFHKYSVDDGYGTERYEIMVDFCDNFKYIK